MSRNPSDLSPRYGTNAEGPAPYVVSLQQVAEQLSVPAVSIGPQIRAAIADPMSMGSPRLQRSSQRTPSDLRFEEGPSSSSRDGDGDLMVLHRPSVVLVDSPRVSSRGPSSRGVAEATALLDDEDEPPLARPKKHVHFPDNVIQSVAFVPRDDGSHQLEVVYNRPWYSYVAFLLSNGFFVASWTELLRASWPSDKPGESLAASVSVISFTSFAFTSVFLLAYVLLTWRPSPYERSMLSDPPFQWRVVKTIAIGAISQLLLTGSYMLHVTCVNSIAFTAFPLIVMFLQERFTCNSQSCISLRAVDQSGVTRTDTAGAVWMFGGLLALVIGEEFADTGDRRLRYGSIALSFLGGGFMAPYLGMVRSASREVSNAVLILLTVIAATGLTAIASWSASGFSSPLGNGTDRVSVFSDLSRLEFFRVLMSGALMFFFWFLHHSVSTYFDRLSVVAGYSLSAPFVLIAYHIQELPTMPVVAEVIGCIGVTVGAFAVVASGWKNRRKVSITLN